jgi:cytidylate kinase
VGEEIDTLVYRKGPLVARTQHPIVVTIDGPAGTGKSSVARSLAERLGLDFLDTGAMYRAAALVAIERKIDYKNDPQGVVREVAAADIKFDWTKRPPCILAWGRPVNERIRDDDVEEIVSPVSAIAALRAHLVEKQKEIGRQHKRLVTEGRDQGSVVFPNAAVKFYLDARPEVRASRRATQLKADGQNVTVGEILADIIARDKSDSSRSTGPLRQPEGSELIDTSDLTFDGVVDLLEERVRARVATL